MNIILKQDVDMLGSKFDVVTVKDGYARNFLIPQGLAVAATASNIKVNDEVIRQQAHKAAKAKEAATAIAAKLEGLSLKLGAKAGESGKILVPSTRFSWPTPSRQPVTTSSASNFSCKDVAVTTTPSRNLALTKPPSSFTKKWW